MHRITKFSLITCLLFISFFVCAEISYDKSEEINGLNKAERIGQIEGKFKETEAKLAKISELSSEQEKVNKSVSELKEGIKNLKEDLKKIKDEMSAKGVLLQKAKDMPVSAEDFNYLKRENEKFKNDLDETRRSMSILRQRIEALEKDNFKR